MALTRKVWTHGNGHKNFHAQNKKRFEWHKTQKFIVGHLKYN